MVEICFRLGLKGTRRSLGPDRLLHRMSRMCEILFARDSNIVLRSSLDMWFSQKQRLRSVSSGKEVLWCGERLGSGFRSDSGEYEFFFKKYMKGWFCKHIICETVASGACEEDGWSAGSVLPQLNLEVCRLLRPVGQELNVAKICPKSFYIRIQVGGFGLQHFMLYCVAFMVRFSGVHSYKGWA